MERLVDLNDETFNDDDNDAYSVSERIFFRMFPDDDGDRAAAAEFWELVASCKYPGSSYIAGFSAGAAGVRASL